MTCVFKGSIIHTDCDGEVTHVGVRQQAGCYKHQAGARSGKKNRRPRLHANAAYGTRTSISSMRGAHLVHDGVFGDCGLGCVILRGVHAERASKCRQLLALISRRHLVVVRV